MNADKKQLGGDPNGLLKMGCGMLSCGKRRPI
jgi:hypothetical protein